MLPRVEVLRGRVPAYLPFGVPMQDRALEYYKGRLYVAHRFEQFCCFLHLLPPIRFTVQPAYARVS